MCRYAMLHAPNKRHFACFSCRKAFKQSPIVNYLAVQSLGYAYAELSRIRHHAASLEREETPSSADLERALGGGACHNGQPGKFVKRRRSPRSS